MAIPETPEQAIESAFKDFGLNVSVGAQAALMGTLMIHLRPFLASGVAQAAVLSDPLFLNAADLREVLAGVDSGALYCTCPGVPSVVDPALKVKHMPTCKWTPVTRILALVDGRTS